MAESHLEGSQGDDIILRASDFTSKLNEKIHSKIMRYIGNNLDNWDKEEEKLL